MNITLTSLEALVLKATHESLSEPDRAAVEAFCAVMRDSAEGPQLAAQALAARIHSTNPREAQLALIMLDSCMRRCDANFHAEVGKFRFLNEMIKLVSPKYFADRTAPEVRARIVQLLHIWPRMYPKESKFKVALDMLKNQGVIKEIIIPTPLDTPLDESSLKTRPEHKVKIAFCDEEKSKLLQKLLQSKKPEDLQHANRLIKTMVREEERRSEAKSRRTAEVTAALDSAGLLRDMLRHARDASADEEQLIHELHAGCERLRAALQRLAATETDTDNLNDILHANNVLDEVSNKYDKFVVEKRLKPINQGSQQSNSQSLLDFAGANATRTEDVPKTRLSNAIDDLGDIFSNDISINNIAEPLKPFNLMCTDDTELLGQKEKKVEGWNELDSLSEKLLKESLPENSRRSDTFNSKHTKKIPMNALEKSSPKHESQATNNTALLDLDFFTSKPKEQTPTTSAHSSKSSVPNDDIMVDISSGDNPRSNVNDNATYELSCVALPSLQKLSRGLPLDRMLDTGLPLAENKTDTVVDKSIGKDNENMNSKVDSKPLTDSNIMMEVVHSSKTPPLTAYEEPDGLTVALHICREKPRPDVHVVVVTTTSRNRAAIHDYKFHPILPKGYKFRLMRASGTSLPAYNPLVPPAAVEQMMLLLAAPPLAELPLKFVLTYTCRDQPCTELGEVPRLPLLEGCCCCHQISLATF